jgi:hypothetical protein
MLVDCYDHDGMMEDGDGRGGTYQLVKTVKLPEQQEDEKGVGVDKAKSMRRLAEVRDLHRQVKLVLRMQQTRELERLATLISKWCRVITEILACIRAESSMHYNSTNHNGTAANLTDRQMALSLGLSMDAISKVFSHEDDEEDEFKEDDDNLEKDGEDDEFKDIDEDDDELKEKDEDEAEEESDDDELEKEEDGDGKDELSSSSNCATRTFDRLID